MKPSWVKEDPSLRRGYLGCPLNTNRMAVPTSTKAPAIDSSDMPRGSHRAAMAAVPDEAALSMMRSRGSSRNFCK
jgi:hypothetical protein